MCLRRTQVGNAGSNGKLLTLLSLTPWFVCEFVRQHASLRKRIGCSLDSDTPGRLPRQPWLPHSCAIPEATCSAASGSAVTSTAGKASQHDVRKFLALSGQCRGVIAASLLNMLGMPALPCKENSRRLLPSKQPRTTWGQTATCTNYDEKS